MGKTTDNLLKQLSDVSTVSELHKYTSAAAKAGYKLTFHEYLSDILNSSSLSARELIHRSGIQRNYAYQILNGTKRPGRNKVLSLCIAAGLTLDETQKALTIAGEAILYPKSKRDSILIFCINKKSSVQQTNELLYELNEDIL